MFTGKPGHLDDVYNKKQIRKILIRALLYLGFFLVFYLAFTKILPYYITDPSKYGPVDSRAADLKFFDATYVYDAKHEFYKRPGYFQLFLPLDLGFPIVYTLMFLAVLSVFKKKTFYKPARYFVFAGMIFDYLENFTFSLYLKSSIELSSLVAFFTTIKTFLFVFNFGVFVIALFCASFIFFKTKKDGSRQNRINLPG